LIASSILDFIYSFLLILGLLPGPKVEFILKLII
jgi:hypothetical protein